MQKSVAFFERNSWYHRTKVLLEDGTVQYGKKGGFQSEEEAKQNYYKCEKQFKQRQRQYQISYKKNMDILFKDYLIYWFEEVYSQRIETTTRMIGAYTLYGLIVPCLGYDMKLRYINTEYLDELLVRVSKTCNSAGNKGRELLNLALKDAVIEGYLKINPVPDTIPYKRKTTKLTILSKSQVKVFLKFASEDNWYLEILLGLFCGLRKGEILGLKFADFNLERKTVSINRQIVANPIIEKGNRIAEYSLIEREPKTSNSFRILRVPDIIVSELQQRKLLVEANKKRFGDKYNNRDYISCQTNGNPHSLAAMNTALKKLCQRNGLPAITVHGLRHMFATILLENQVPLIKISGLLGHSSVNTTFEYYCEEMEEKENIIAYMNDTFSPELNRGVYCGIQP